MLDDTIERNIALGLDKVDAARLEVVARQASLHDFVRALPQGYATVLGERGVNLSGGQRQRIGLARALYHAPSLLILDEATNALDNITEAEVWRALSEEPRTLLVIAHRLNTVQACGQICLVENGRLAASGSYSELLESCPAFAELCRTD